jgi:asparagine synthase (glutamine-hydrolysing)
MDLSMAGHQPMVNAEETVFIAFNGEIYNAAELRRPLESGGRRFRSRTDTEVLLHLYEQKGMPAMLECLNGMFAICVVDLGSREIHLARDPFGIKPLYWAQQGATFLFASEVKAFLCHPAFSPQIDPGALDEYLAFRFCAGERFLLKGVHQIEPGQRLRIGLQGCQRHKYWQIPDCPREAGGSREATMDELDSRLRQSVASHLVADVKIGCQLSGGVDSTLVTLAASSQIASRLDAFSVVLPHSALSEEPWIDQVAAAIPIRCHRFPLDASYVVDHLDRVTWHLDQPVGMPGTLGIYRLAEGARSRVTVLLSGEGSDELFGGYDRFYDQAVRQRLLPWMPVLSKVPVWGRRLGRRFRVGLSAEDSFILSSAALSPRRLAELRPAADLEDILRRRRALFEGAKDDILGRCMKYDMQTYMVDLLVRQDKASMAHSIETRVPSLDRDLVTFGRSLPTDYLVKPRILRSSGHARNTKVLLKELAARTFGQDFAFRPKCGLLLPLDEYLMSPAFAERMEDQLLPGIRRRGWLEGDVVDRLWRDFQKTRRGAGRLWQCMAIEVWAQMFLDGRQPDGPHRSARPGVRAWTAHRRGQPAVKGALEA